MRRFAILAGALLALAFAAPVARAAPQVIGPSTAQLQVETGKGRLVRLDRPASSVFVADPEIADIQVKSPSLVYVIGKNAGETTLFAVGERDEVLVNMGIVVRHNVARLQQALQELVPGTLVKASSVDDSLVLSGTVYSAAEGEDVRRIAAKFVPDQAQLVNKTEVDAPNQINLRVRVAEMARETTKALGFNFESILAPGNFLFGLATGNPVLQAGAILAPGKTAPVSIPPLQQPAGTLPFLTRQNGVNNLTAAFHGGRTDINSMIDALEKEGLVTILAEPNLTALSGEAANFLAGGEFPILVPQGNNTISIDFKKFGVSLSFIATIGARDRIHMRVKPEVSQLSGDGAIVLNGITIPALTTRRAETTVELGSGQTFAVAGLLQNNVKHDLSKFPWLGDVPILGTLFRSDRFQRNESELVIIVTPYLVRPVTAKRMQAPTDGFVSPSDQERVLGGVTHRPQLPQKSTVPTGRSAATLLGPVGFELE